MKLVIAIVAKEKLTNIKEELSDEEVCMITAADSIELKECYQIIDRSEGKQKQIKQVMIIIAVKEDKSYRIVQAIIKGAKDERTTGKIFIVDLCECVSIGTGEGEIKL